MAKNDKILIDGIIDERVNLRIPSEKRDEAFEYFAFEQILKDFDFSSEEIISGCVDGRNDGGIDGFYIIVNGHLLSDLETFSWPKSGAELEIWIITCKHHDTFKQAPLDNLVASIVELFDFTINNGDLKGIYSERIFLQRENLKFAYRKISPRLSKFSINFCYASRGNTTELGDSIVSRANQIIRMVKDSFGNCSSEFHFYGSSELIDLYRKTPNFSLEIPFIEDLSSGQTYILLVKLNDYYSFIQDNGKLRRYLFDSNVRDFMGLNRVNEDIKATLNNDDSPDFWWLNNGVTILATGASVIGKSIQIQDIQIVNGLQTSESIYRYFNEGGTDPKNRSILVKVIVSKNEVVRDDIIRATNNQTTVELSSLHATDEIQRDIEDVLKQNNLFYERRTNYYKNQGIPPEKIIKPLYLASGFVTLILKSPKQATSLRSKFMRVESSYKKVFSTNVDLKLWPKIAFILKSTDIFLESVRPRGRAGSENFLKSRRQILSFLTVSRLLGNFNFCINDIVNLNLANYDSKELSKSWKLVTSIQTFNRITKKIKHSELMNLLEKAEHEWGIKGIKRFAKGNMVILYDDTIEKSETNKVKVTMEFALRVNELLPPQPWKPGIDKEIVEKLKCTRVEFFAAVRMLISEGLRYRQKDGVVYDDDGNVVSFDEERVDSETLRLKLQE